MATSLKDSEETGRDSRWCKVALVAEGGTLKARQHAVSILGLKNLPEAAQVGAWETTLSLT